MTGYKTLPASLRSWISRGALTACLMAAGPAGHAWAQSPGGGDVTGRLIELLVKKGVLPADEAAKLLAEARQEKPKPVKKPDPPPDNSVHVTYVPQIVKDDIARQVRSDLVATMKNGGWPSEDKPATVLERLRFFGDIRLRGELDYLPGSNAAQFPDFGTINGGSPYDVTGASGNVPLLNTTHDRTRMRLRARAGIDAQIDDSIMAEVRVATGNDGSPVTANQTLGQNGPFTKYALWLDRAFVKATPYEWLTAYAGRMTNPFWTTDLMYYDDLGFDGIAGSLTPRLGKNATGFLTAGAFPVFNTALNFGSTSANSSYASRDAWLFAVQAGAELRAAEYVNTKIAAGYFSYSDVGGKISSPCTIVFSSDVCTTDNSRALFPGTGNTMIPLRRLVSAPNNTQPQYFGLASQFRMLDVHGKVDIDRFAPVIISLDGDFAINTAFNRSRAVALGVNNFNGANVVDPGNKAWMVRLTAGTREIAARWDWNVSLAYKYIESDSVLASLNDPDFHLGGTNAKGFILGGNLGLAHNTWLTGRWLSSTQVSGPPFTVNVVQADLNVRF